MNIDIVTHQRRRTLALAIATALLLVGGCAQSDESKDSPAAQGSIEGLGSLFTSWSFDYIVAESGADLAEYADIVVVGQPDGLAAGPTHKDEVTLAPTRSVVLKVTVEDVLLGQLPDDANDTVYLYLPETFEIASMGIERADAIARNATAPGVFYLNLVNFENEVPGWIIEDQEAGRPAGQPLFQPVSPQGFVLSMGLDKTAQILEYKVYDEPLESFFPDSPELPSAEALR